MRVSSRSSSSLTFFLVLFGTSALLVLLVVTITGGFVIDAGPFHFSSRRWLPPLVLAVVAWGAAFTAGGSPDVSTALARLADGVERYARIAALLIAVSAVGAGVGLGTHAASAADASGYVSQSRLLAAARVSHDEPLARQIEWTNSTWVFSPLGYRPGARPGELVPTYPPGLPLMMAAAALVGGQWAPFLVVPVLGGVAVFATYRLGVRLHSRRTGLFAALLLATSPIFLFQLVQPMSDIPAVAWWAIALNLALSPRAGASFAAGVAAGLALLARPNLLPLVAPVGLLVAGWPRVRGIQFPRSGHLIGITAGLIPAVAILGLMQWRLYGSPLASGHGAFSDFFALSNVWPNIGAYSRWLIRGEAASIGLAFVSLVAIAWARRTRGPSAEPGITPVAIAAALLSAFVLLCYLPYGVFFDWFYLRFLLPAFPLAFVLNGALAGRGMAALPRPVGTLTLLVAMTTAASANIVIARREQAFNLRDFEQRYLKAGRYVDAVLPPESVIFAVQESGSARYYARPIVRWDLLPVDLDAAVATLTAMHRNPVLLVEDWEADDLRRRFPGSAIARLDWRPRADIGTSTHVLLFDPADRDQPSRQMHTDRFR